MSRPPIQVPVDEFTSPSPVTSAETADCDELAGLMQEHGIRHLPILRDGTVVGMVSARDLKVLTALEPERRALVTAADIMTPDPVAVRSSDRLDDVALLMSERKIGSVVVLDEDNRFYGIFTATDALNALVEIARGALD